MAGARNIWSSPGMTLLVEKEERSYFRVIYYHKGPLERKLLV